MMLSAQLVLENILDSAGRYDPKLEAVLKNRRRLGRYMPSMKVIPPGLDFSSLKVALPEDPARKEMELMKPAYNARITSSPRHSRQTEDVPEHRPCGLFPDLSSATLDKEACIPVWAGHI